MIMEKATNLNASIRHTLEVAFSIVLFLFFGLAFFGINLYLAWANDFHPQAWCYVDMGGLGYALSLFTGMPFYIISSMIVVFCLTAYYRNVFVHRNFLHNCLRHFGMITLGVLCAFNVIQYLLSTGLSCSNNLMIYPQ